jgi:hypothetical protein
MANGEPLVTPAIGAEHCDSSERPRRATARTDACRAAQPTLLKGPAAMALAAAVQSVFEGGAYR